MMFFSEKKNFRTVFILMSVLFLLGTAIPVFSQSPQLGAPTELQQIFNRLPAVTIAGNSLNFQFGGDTWIATLNGRNFLAGTVTTHDTSEGSILVLKQTHTYPAAPAQAGGAAGGALSALGRVTGWISMSGPEIFLEYRQGPPASFRAISRSDLPEEIATAAANDSTTASSERRQRQQRQSSEREPRQGSSSEPAQGSILAIFGWGGQFLGMEREAYRYVNLPTGETYPTPPTQPTTENETLANGVTVGVNLLFIGKSGFTISAGVDAIFDVGIGVNADPTFGLGYVYKRSFYLGGILNLIPKPYFYDFKGDPNGQWKWSNHTMFIAPTLVIGYDFGGFVLGGQMSFMVEPTLGTTGFKFSLGVGVSIENIF